MKFLAPLFSAVLILCGCERHSAEETAPLHEAHGTHHAEGEHQKSGATETKTPDEHAEKPAAKSGADVHH